MGKNILILSSVGAFSRWSCPPESGRGRQGSGRTRSVVLRPDGSRNNFCQGAVRCPSRYGHGSRRQQRYRGHHERPAFSAAATGRDVVIKCDGCYHGHADHLLVAAGSGAATLGSPDSAGVPKDFAKNTIVVPFNDAKAVAAVMDKHGSKIAAIIIEPVAGNMGFIPPKRGYLQALRKLCTANGSLLVFDEVMTGFRVGWGGAQVRFGVNLT